MRVVGALLIAAQASAAPQPARVPRVDRENGLRQAVWGERFLEGIARYDALSHEGFEPSGQAAYLAGFSYWKLNQPENARPLLQKAFDAGFQAGGGRPQPGELLERFGRYLGVKPPRVEVPGLDPTALEVFADEKTPLTAPILAALPRFVEIGRRIFGGPPPPARFFLFGKEEALRRFYDALGINAQRSTGTTNFVVVCEEKVRRATRAETISMALHETGHAWVAGYMRARHDRGPKMPVYMTEGLAVYIASMWDDKVRALAPERVRQWRARGAKAPAFDDLAPFGSFHEPGKANVNYLLSGLLRARLLGPPPTGAARIPALLDALARKNDAAAAWREATGKDVRAEYQALVFAYWHEFR